MVTIMRPAGGSGIVCDALVASPTGFVTHIPNWGCQSNRAFKQGDEVFVVLDDPFVDFGDTGSLVLHKYVISTDTWASISALPSVGQVRVFFDSGSLVVVSSDGNRVIVNDSSSAQTTAWKNYNISAGTWSTFTEPNVNGLRKFQPIGGCRSADGTLYFAIGDGVYAGSSSTADTGMFIFSLNPATNAWTQVSSTKCTLGGTERYPNQPILHRKPDGLHWDSVNDKLIITHTDPAYITVYDPDADTWDSIAPASGTTLNNDFQWDNVSWTKSDGDWIYGIGAMNVSIAEGSGSNQDRVNGDYARATRLIMGYRISDNSIHPVGVWPDAFDQVATSKTFWHNDYLYVVAGDKNVMTDLDSEWGRDVNMNIAPFRMKFPDIN